MELSNGRIDTLSSHYRIESGEDTHTRTVYLGDLRDMIQAARERNNYASTNLKLLERIEALEAVVENLQE